MRQKTPRYASVQTPVAWASHKHSSYQLKYQACVHVNGPFLLISCVTVWWFAAGARVWVRYAHGTSSTPLYADGVYFHNGFTGFKLY